MHIGPWQLPASKESGTIPLFLAPMAGVTDRPFRNLCRQLGASLAISEMVTSRSDLLHTRKTQSRLNHEGEAAPISVQILGTDARQMAEAARFNEQHGAHIIDINMGCPAKKVCNVAAGSALLKNEVLVEEILTSVVEAVSIPVTLKIRTGWDRDNRNALSIARIAEQCGIKALTIHGRTRACGYSGDAEYDTIKTVKQQLNIPIIANGDINSAEKAQSVIQYTGADAIMIGRKAIESPWIFSDINHYLKTGTHLPEPSLPEKKELILGLLDELYRFYGFAHGTRIARKHIAATIKPLVGGQQFWKEVNRVNDAHQQFAMTEAFFDRCA